MTNKLSRAGYLRNLADAVEWDEAGKTIQFEITNIAGSDEWIDYSILDHGYMNTLSANRWRIKPEPREFKPGILRDWLTQEEAFSADKKMVFFSASVPSVYEYFTVDNIPDALFSKRLVYATREQAEVARKALGWEE